MIRTTMFFLIAYLHKDNATERYLFLQMQELMRPSEKIEL